MNISVVLTNNKNNKCATYSLNESIDYFSADTFSFLHHNIRSYTHNFDEFSCLLKDIDEKIDTYVFSETWFNSQNYIPMPIQS